MAWLFWFCFIQVILYLCRGYGFVKFTDELEQKRALTECQGAVGLGSKPVRLSVAIPKAWVWEQPDVPVRAPWYEITCIFRCLLVVWVHFLDVSITKWRNTHEYSKVARVSECIGIQRKYSIRSRQSILHCFCLYTFLNTHTYTHCV